MSRHKQWISKADPRRQLVQACCDALGVRLIRMRVGSSEKRTSSVARAYEPGPWLMAQVVLPSTPTKIYRNTAEQIVEAIEEQLAARSTLMLERVRDA